MTLFVARTPDNGLYIFVTKPFWREDLKMWCEWRRWTTESDRLTYGYIFDSDLLPEVTFENSPMEVELKIKHNEMRFSPMFRLFDRIVIKDPSDIKRIVKYTEKLIDKLKEEGFYADAKCAEEYLKVFNGELVELVIKKKEQD